MKRLTSLVLAFCMLASMAVPTAFAADETTQTYTFYDVKSSWSATNIHDITYADTTDGTWQWHSMSSDNSATKTAAQKATYLQISQSTKRFVALTFKAPQGKHTATLNIRAHSAGTAECSVYILPQTENMDVKSAIAAATPAAEGIYFNDTAKTAFPLGEHNFTQEEYVIVFYTTKSGNVWVKDMTLAPASDDTPDTPVGEFSGKNEDYKFYDIAAAKKDSSGYITMDGDYAVSVENDWAWYAISDGNNCTIRSRTLNAPGAFMQLSQTNKAWCAFSIKVPASGKYFTSFTIDTYGSGAGEAEIYILPKSTEDIGTAIIADNLYATIDFNDDSLGATGWGKETVPIKAFVADSDVYTATGGEYLLVFKQTRGGNIRPKTLHLVGNVGELSSIEISCDKETVGVGDNANISLTAEDSNGNILYANNLTSVTYKSSDEKIATVDGSGTITGVTNGRVTINVKAEWNTSTLETSIPVIVSDPLVFAGIREEYTLKDTSANWDPTIMGWSDNTGRVEDIRGITYKYTDSGNWEWYGTSSDWVAGPSSVWAYSGTGKASYRLRLGIPQNSWLGLTINVPKAGKYVPIINYAGYGTEKSAGISDIYIVPKDAGDVDAMLTDEYYLGRINYYSPEAEENGFTYESESFGAIDIPVAGEYILIFKQMSNSTGKYHTVKTLELEGRFLNALECTLAEEIGVGASEDISFLARHIDGSELTAEELDSVTYDTNDRTVATVDSNGKVTGVGDGTTTIVVTGVLDGTSRTQELPITVVDKSIPVSADIAAPSVIYLMGYASNSLSVSVNMESGAVVSIPNDNVTYIVDDESIVKLNEDYTLTAVSEGTTTVRAKVEFRGASLESEAAGVTVKRGFSKTEPTIYTYAKRENAVENAKKYEWARSSRDNAADMADGYIEHIETIRDLMIGEGIPRSNRVGTQYDPEYNYCRYCATDIVGKYGGTGTGGWDTNPITRPWKVQCPECKRVFPTNDFGSFLKLGLDEKGYFDRQRALDKHHSLLHHGAINAACECTVPEKEGTKEWLEYYGYGNENGYLYNELYDDLEKVETLNVNKGLRAGENVATWGVDDGFGYIPRDENGNGYTYTVENRIANERHSYVAHFNHNFWENFLRSNVLQQMMNAYLYTGDKKYGQAGAILLDRIADLLPEYDWWPYQTEFYTSHGSTFEGTIIGRITNASLYTLLGLMTDAFYPMIYDEQVQKSLMETAEKYNLDNDKSSPELIWQNWADRILVETYEIADEAKIWGNFGMMQNALATAAISLDDPGMTDEILRWTFQKGEKTTGKVTGGNVAGQLVDVVDRDGMGNEAAVNYNSVWIQNMYNMSDVLTNYKGDGDYNIFKNPKYAQMFAAFIPTTLVGTHSVQLGDGGAVASLDFYPNLSYFVNGFEYLKETPHAEEIAKYIYTRNGYTTDNLHYGIFVKDPESIQEEIESYIDTYPEQKSEMMTGYGFAVMRDGIKSTNATAQTATNTLRDFWMNFGNNVHSHAHPDSLGIGMEAYGLNFMPDNGYPVSSASVPNRAQWSMSTLAHNAVTVNGERQEKAVTPHATPLHFDDSGEVKLVDVSSPKAYKATDIYRRTLVMIKINDEASYGVDFFRVKGGDKHEYSMHSQSDTLHETEGLELTHQVNENGDYIGTLAGPDVPFGDDSKSEYQRGYTWLKNVRYDMSPEKEFAADFEIKDFRKAISDSKGLHLRVTMLNDFELSRVAIAGGSVPPKEANSELPETIEYLIAERSGKNLDSLFTTVYEPYKNERFLSGMTAVDISTEETEGADDTAYAIRVDYANGNSDYVMYAANNDLTYTVTDGEREIAFRGFVGVYRVNESGDCIYRYVGDGDIIGSETQKVSAYTGKVIDFTRELQFDNSISVSLNEIVDCADLAGRYIYVNNDGVQNGAYKIIGAEEQSDGTVCLDIGTISPIRSYKDSDNIDGGYNYNIAVGQTFVIPSSYEEDNMPAFDEISDNLSTSAGSSVSVSVNATSPVDAKITYEGTILPRGASVNAETGVVTWKPDASQVGENHFAVTAMDSDGRESTAHFTVTVYGATTGSTTFDETNNANNSSTSVGGGGGGGGSSGQGSTDGSDTGTDNNDQTNVGETPSVGDASSSLREGASGERFIDLGNHAWAADSINTLADDGIIKGTTATTYSPAASITRADYAILLVRAFGLESDDTTNFSDVNPSDYFAAELAIARNTGIVQGIGGNKYAPRNPITRQDMMVIMYRALEKLGKLGDAERNDTQVVPYADTYPDYADVADYAKPAVNYLISGGLVNGKNGLIAPTDYTTRAEVAVLIKRILDYTSK